MSKIILSALLIIIKIEASVSKHNIGGFLSSGLLFFSFLFYLGVSENSQGSNFIKFFKDFFFEAGSARGRYFLLLGFGSD